MKSLALKVLVAAAAAFWVASMARAQPAPEFIFTSIAGTAQTVTTGHLFPVRFAVRLTDLDGKPLPSAQVNFQNEGCITIPGIPCEFPGDPGHFESGSDNATMVTDAAGIAIAPPYYAGSEAGAIGIEVIVLPNIAPYYFGVSQVLTYNVEFRLQQVAGQPIAAVPAQSFFASLLLCIAFSITGAFLVRRRGAR